MSKLTTTEFSDAAQAIMQWRRPLLLSHTKPDGDAVGSLVAMRELLSGLDISAKPVVFDEIPARYSGLLRFGRLPQLGKDVHESLLGEVDAVVILDTCASAQLHPIIDWLNGCSLPKLVVDHHITRDAIADAYLIDESSAATCLIILQMAQVMDWEISSGAAEALFVGIAADTGWFRHSNTNNRVFAAASQLSEMGVKPNQLFQRMYQCDSVSRVKLLGLTIDRMELYVHERLAILGLPEEAFSRTGSVLAETEDLVNEPMRIKNVVVSVILVQHADGVVRVGLRSKAPLSEDDPDIDVAAIARSLGGGGHRRAAGVRLGKTLDEAKAIIIDAFRPLL